MMTAKIVSKVTLALAVLIAGSFMATAAMATSRTVIVPIGAECPAGMWPIAPAYERVNGKWTHVGTLCEEAMKGG